VWSVVRPPLPWLYDDPEKLALARRSEPLYGAIGMTFVRLSPGEHRVELRYRPPGLVAGIAAAAIGVLALVICAFRLPPS
jgi:uncharacterized membrane protein YfhO